MNILIIGGTGFLSSRITELLLANGHSVTLLNRGKTKSRIPENKNLSIVTGDRNDKRILTGLTSKIKFDAVYDMIAYNEEDSLTAVEAFRNKVGRFIHCSTISVYMLAEEVKLPVTEDQINLPLMKIFKRSPFGWDYGINKIKCEDILWKNHDEKSFSVTMLRPTYISGPGDPAARDFFWIERILDGDPLLVPGDGRFKFQQVYIDDAANAFCKVIETDKSLGEAYNVAGEEVFSLNEYILRLSKLLNRTPEIYHLPLEQFDELDISYSTEGDVFTFNTRRNAVFSLRKIKEQLKFSPTPFDDYMAVTIEWFLSKVKGHSSGYSKRSEEVKIINSLKINA